jgi:hypothetical protein
MQPRPEIVHWMFATGFLALALFLLSEAIVGREIWRQRAWRAYLWPSLAFIAGLFMWPVMVLFTNSTIHMLTHGVWAQALMVAGAVQLALVRGKVSSQYWEVTMAAAILVSGVGFLVHEQNGWLFSRSAFLHHVLGWTLVVGSIFPLLRTFRPRSALLETGFALTVLAVAVLLYADRDVAPIFGHLSDVARGAP